MSSARKPIVTCAFVVLALTACDDKPADPKPGDKPAAVAGKTADQPAPASPAPAPAPAGEDFSPTLYNLGMWSEMHAFCGWKTEPFKDLRARLLAAPKLAAAKPALESHFDRGVAYGADQAKMRADQKAKGETPSAWACGADVEASVLQEIDKLLAAK